MNISQLRDLFWKIIVSKISSFILMKMYFYNLFQLKIILICEKLHSLKMVKVWGSKTNRLMGKTQKWEQKDPDHMRAKRPNIIHVFYICFFGVKFYDFYLLVNFFFSFPLMSIVPINSHTRPTAHFLLKSPKVQFRKRPKTKPINHKEETKLIR